MLVLPNICNLLRRLASSATTTVGNKPPYQIKEVILLDDKEINTIVRGLKKVELVEQGKNKFIRGFICFQKILYRLFVLCLIFNYTFSHVQFSKSVKACLVKISKSLSTQKFGNYIFNILILKHIILLIF